MLDSHWMPFHAGDGREDEADGEHGDDGDEHHVAGLADAGDDLQAGADLQGTEAERGGGAEERREDREACR